jgi:hypothetical protein
MYCTVHFIITLFNVGNVLLCAIYQLNFTVFMYVTRISRSIERSVLSAVSRNRGRSWNVLPVDAGAIPNFPLFFFLYSPMQFILPYLSSYHSSVQHPNLQLHLPVRGYLLVKRRTNKPRERWEDRFWIDPINING